ncbi:hypothetical protein BIV25_21095 [Streptomyces sp. MUSC 14]|uniref:hypothetical protein n=1 Tax=Streptomyces sp. MUSC 14 TaxID=1354889 RepID=UPI0008F5F281|nr:hypothetical protein [Streptomyces sp. MUSC 14]OIJ94891.1 hypothetical protein BIV25_21095 [Streptomyces sp. MUSC 14]
MRLEAVVDRHRERSEEVPHGYGRDARPPNGRCALAGRPERLVPCEWSESTPLPLDARWDSDLEDVLLDDLASAWSAGHHR